MYGKDRNVDNIANIRWYTAWGLNDNEQAREEEDIRLKRGQWMTFDFRNGRHGVPLSLTSYGSAQQLLAALLIRVGFWSGCTPTT